MNEKLKEILKDKKVLIFDFDGTMLGTERFNYLVHKKNWKKYGIDLTEDGYRDVMGKTVIEIKSSIETDVDVDEQTLIDEYINGFLELTKSENLPMFDYFYDLMQSCDGKKLYILSNQSTKIIDSCLQKWGIKDKFEKVISLIDSIDVKKIDYYRNTEKYFGAPQADCVLFEDTQKNIDDGMLCGIFTVGIKHKFNNPIADFVVDTNVKE